MAENRSFLNYISESLYNQFYSYIENHIELEQHNLNLETHNVHTVGDITLTDAVVKMASIDDLPGMRINFDVVLEAEIKVSEGDYHYDEFDLCYKWFKLNCTGDLACSLDDFNIKGIEDYSQRSNMDKPLSDALVPYIYAEELESVATEFLNKHYPEVLKEPSAIDPKELVSRMGLTVEIRDITKDLSIFGQVYFHDSEAELYDSNKDETITEEVKAGTIFVDPKSYFLRNLGAVNNTIVHECVHWDKHRKAFELERLYSSSANKIKCQSKGGIKGSERDATDWMEWQANALAPRIQMPLPTFKLKVFEFTKHFKREKETSEITDVIETVIDSLSVFFCVSRLAAKIRMIDLGYEEAMGAFLYIDNHYIKPHRFKKGALKRNQTFSIDSKDAIIQSLINPEIKKGNYLYIDSHFVLNHPKYVSEDLLGELRLTEYANTNMDECCLIFELSVRSDIKEKYHTECYLNRDEESPIVFDVRYNGGYQNSTPEKQNELLKGQLLEENQIYSQLTNDYRSCLKVVKKWRGLTNDELADKTLLHERTIRGISSGDRSGSIEALVLICLALKLPPRVSNHIIDNSPYSLDLQNESHACYDFALAHKYSLSMNEISRFLSEMGANPL